MVEMKWTLLAEIDPKRNYLAFSEMGERKSAWSYFSWLMRSRKVAEQLKTAKGIIGFTARLEFFSKKGVMVAVFEDETTLMGFAHAGQHTQCMEKSKPELKEGMKYARWSISGSDIPPKIEDAINKIQNKKIT
jgi:hypothetical protein